MKFLIATLFLAASVHAADTKTVTVSAHGSPALALTVPASATVTTNRHMMTEIRTKQMILCVWSVDKAKTVDEGVTQLADLIKHEVKNFTGKTTNSITVAGAPAKHIIGRGVEADDEDPASADVVVFTVGKNVFATAVHGEGNQAEEERPHMLETLKTAKAP